MSSSPQDNLEYQGLQFETELECTLYAELDRFVSAAVLFNKSIGEIAPSNDAVRYLISLDNAKIALRVCGGPAND